MVSGGINDFKKKQVYMRFTENDDPVLEVKIFGWSVHRVFRDQEKNILKIILEKNGIFKEFVWSELNKK